MQNWEQNRPKPGSTDRVGIRTPSSWKLHNVQFQRCRSGEQQVCRSVRQVKWLSSFTMVTTESVNCLAPQVCWRPKHCQIRPGYKMYITARLPHHSTNTPTTHANPNLICRSDFVWNVNIGIRHDLGRGSKSTPVYNTFFSLWWRHISVMLSQITDNSTVCSIACSGTKNIYHSSALLAFLCGGHSNGQ